MSQGGMAWHLLGRNEATASRGKENQDYQFWTSLMFWQRTLLADQAG